MAGSAEVDHLALKTRSPAVEVREVDESLPDPAQRALAAAYAEYRTAMTGWLAAAKAGHVGVGEVAAERLLQARVALYRALVGTGWAPPPGVTAQLDRDAALIDASEDFDALLAV